MKISFLFYFSIVVTLQSDQFAKASSSNKQQVSSNKGAHKSLLNKYVDSKHPPQHVDIEHLEVDSHVDNPEEPNITVALIFRALYLIIIFLPLLLTSGFAYISAIFRKYVWFQILSFAISMSGAAFIKWGQWSSTRSDMFPEEFCSLLSELQSNAPRHSYKYTEEMIRKELGMPIHEIFDYFSKDPVASGSVCYPVDCILIYYVIWLKNMLFAFFCFLFRLLKYTRPSCKEGMWRLKSGIRM